MVEITPAIEKPWPSSERASPARVGAWEPERGPRPESGYIGLQHHDDKAVLYFREITLTPLKTDL